MADTGDITKQSRITAHHAWRQAAVSPLYQWPQGSAMTSNTKGSRGSAWSANACKVCA